MLKVAEDSESAPNAITFGYEIENGEASNSKFTTHRLPLPPQTSSQDFMYDLQVTDTAQDVYENIGQRSDKNTAVRTFRVNDDVDSAPRSSLVYLQYE